MHCRSIQDTADQIFQFLSKQNKTALRLATPLGLGKPNQLLNEVYRRFKADPSLQLEIYTALSLDPPVPKGDMERRFLQPFLDRHFGANYPRLDYVQDLKCDQFPPNIQLHEFYIEAGQYSLNTYMQSNYTSINYTQVVRNLLERKVDVVLQLISEQNGRYSLSCNPDLTLDLVDGLKESGRPYLMVGVVHPDLPFIGGDAVVPESFFDILLSSNEIQHKLFALPRSPIDASDFMIGLHASRLVPDDATLQIGIGSLSDAIVYSLILRQRDNARYRRIIKDILRPDEEACLEPFTKGLYGSSEMLMDGFMHLRKADILKRLIEQGEARYYLEGAFFLGSSRFYDWLRTLKDEDYSGLSMTRISRVNALFDRQDRSQRQDRKKGRFFNTCMSVDILGGVASETLPDGRVISGVGGQYNFVSMAMELKDAHSVLMLRSTSFRNGKRRSNIVASQPHVTIPRHLRDVVITEYGVAFLRGKTDAEVIAALIEIADSRFQGQLIRQAKTKGKLPADYRLPDYACHNTAAGVEQSIAAYRKDFSLFDAYPFGSDFTEDEIRLTKALRLLKTASTLDRLKILSRGWPTDDEAFSKEIKRMGLDEPETLKLSISASLLRGALHLTS